MTYVTGIDLCCFMSHCLVSVSVKHGKKFHFQMSLHYTSEHLERRSSWNWSLINAHEFWFKRSAYMSDERENVSSTCKCDTSKFCMKRVS